MTDGQGPRQPEPTESRSKAARWKQRRFLWLLPGVAVVCAIVFVALAFGARAPAVIAPSSGLRCAIVDQLSGIYANPDFIKTNSALLTAAGFQVDVFTGDDITVGFWRDLPARGYRLVIMRVHSGVKESAGSNDHIWVFTGERYSRWRYVLAQVRGQVGGARTGDTGSQPVFAINARYIRDLVRGDFGGTVIINMGCAGFYNDELARAFVDRGASAYIAWNANVGVRYVDRVATSLIHKLYSHGITVDAAVAEIMDETGPDPDFGAVPGYYPVESGTRTIKELAASP